MNPRTTFALALVLGAGVLGLAVVLPRAADPRDAPAAASRPAEPAAAEVSLDLDEPVEPPCETTVGDRIEVQPTASDPVESIRAVASRHASTRPPDPTRLGHLILSAIDRETRLPVDTFTVRLASETRFAEEHPDASASELDLTLTPATYEGLVMAPGYEPLALPIVRVVGGETVRLAPVELLPGFASIHVETSGADRFDGLSVELRGFGRRACERCRDRDPAPASHCAACGFAEEASTLRIGPAGRVDFTRLAHGPFALRVVDAQGTTIGDGQGIDLGFGEAATVLFDVSQTRTVEVELLDSDGASLSTEWSRRLAAPRVEEETDIVVSFEEVGFRVIPIQMEIRQHGAGVGWAAFLPPQPPGTSGGFGVTVIGCGFRKTSRGRPTADRERGPADSLSAEPAAPSLPPTEVPCALDGRGLAILAPLSTSQLEIHFTAENLVADAIVPSGRGPTHVRARLRANDESSATPVLSFRALELGR